MLLFSTNLINIRNIYYYRVKTSLKYLITGFRFYSNHDFIKITHTIYTLLTSKPIFSGIERLCIKNARNSNKPPNALHCIPRSVINFAAIQAKHHIQTPPQSFEIKQLSNYLFHPFTPPTNEWTPVPVHGRFKYRKRRIVYYQCVYMPFVRIYSLSYWTPSPTDHHHAFWAERAIYLPHIVRPIISGHFGIHQTKRLAARLRLMGQTVETVCFGL